MIASTMTITDSDGDVDLVLANSPGASELFLNDGAGTFSQSSTKPLLKRLAEKLGRGAEFDAFSGWRRPIRKGGGCTGSLLRSGLNLTLGRRNATRTSALWQHTPDRGCFTSIKSATAPRPRGGAASRAPCTPRRRPPIPTPTCPRRTRPAGRSPRRRGRRRARPA